MITLAFSISLRSAPAPSQHDVVLISQLRAVELFYLLNFAGQLICVEPPFYAIAAKTQG